MKGGITRRGAGALAVLCLLLAPRGVAADAEADAKVVQVMAKVQRFYDGVKSYRARFSQVFIMRAQDDQQVRSGTVSFATGSRMSFRYDAPHEGRVVSDGKHIRVYIKADKTMYESKLEKSPYSAVLTFLEGKGRLMRDFELRLLDPKRQRVDAGWIIEATPRQATPAYAKVLLYVDEESGRVDRVLILDAQGNSNRFILEQPEVNRKLPAGEFRFSPPRGTKIVKP